MGFVNDIVIIGKFLIGVHVVTPWFGEMRNFTCFMQICVYIFRQILGRLEGSWRLWRNIEDF